MQALVTVLIKTGHALGHCRAQHIVRPYQLNCLKDGTFSRPIWARDEVDVGTANIHGTLQVPMFVAAAGNITVTIKYQNSMKKCSWHMKFSIRTLLICPGSGAPGGRTTSCHKVCFRLAL